MPKRDSYTRADRLRLWPSRRQILDAMRNGKWTDPYTLCRQLNIRNPGTVTSHIRDLKATGFWTYERIRARGKGGLFLYRLIRLKREQMDLFRRAK